MADTAPTPTRLNIRPPSTGRGALDRDRDRDLDVALALQFTPPPVSFLQGLWYVTHSTLPLWKSNRNVTITYTPLENNAEVLDDLVEYQPLTSDKHKKVEGVDVPEADATAAYNWRGKGWLKIASSHWQILGYGDEEGGWMVTYFQKTLFTPAGIDIYARRRGGLSSQLLAQIKHDIRAVKDQKFSTLALLLFPIHHNW
ncbi:hypothetical protein A1O3_06468 [Capronia epimyces CBS 606.96]|uniref:Lipocalin-like domain-containing protein n=1 Tax=Capronia epimyces CBS 606.96 TaxID=1182542 RepID=W9XZ48_9EURO|nr:uncharacterized protein A1O3_06468 [Capronia epimyces CBS 606.96]EXJ82655.1 hypothetical protein A1O3_06468 [Capronia epimyces CBS 606.96]